MTCSMPDCNKPTVGRGLCNSHYQRARTTGTLDDIAPRQQNPCAQCGELIPITRRWGSKFCSIECKQADADARARTTTAEYRRSRVQLCGYCREQLPLERRADAKFCSRSCLDAAGNARKALIEQRATTALRKPCETCGGQIPAKRRRDAVYCSDACKRTASGVMSPPARFGENLRKYGITTDDYQRILASQDGRCSICRTDTWTAKGPHVDHCHTSGRVRGILCHHCNLILGHAKDDPALLRAAATYLEGG